MTEGLSLRFRIFWSSVGSMLLILMAVFFFVDRSLRSTIVAGLEESLVSGALLVGELHRSAVEAGVERMGGLATDPTIRAAVETSDPVTIRRNLTTFYDSTAGSWLAVTSLEGAVLASVGDAPAERIQGSSLLMDQARYYRSVGDLWTAGDTLTEVHVAGLFFDETLLGFLFAGERISDEGHVDRLESGTRQRVAFVADGRLVAGGAGFTAADRASFASAWAGAAPVDDTGVPSVFQERVREFELEDGAHLGAEVPLFGASSETVGTIVAFRSLREAMAPARTLRVALLTIAAVGVALAMVFSWLLSRTVTRPIDRLLKETVRLGSGDLDHPVEPERDDEIGRLAQGFEKMRASLAGAQKELIRAERLSAIGQAASHIVHDIRQPVTVIRARADLLSADVHDPSAREDLEAIQGEVGRLTSMMQELLDFARGEDRMQMESGSVPELLGEIAGRHGAHLEDRGIHLEVQDGYDGSWVLDRRRTARVIGNLVENAAAAIGREGRIGVRSALTQGCLRIEVEDDGPGIPSSMRDNLFEPFMTEGKAEGTGLGLAIAQSFTERQGGEIRFRTSDRGTVFILTFPASPAWLGAEVPA